MISPPPHRLLQSFALASSDVIFDSPRVHLPCLLHMIAFRNENPDQASVIGVKHISDGTRPKYDSI